MTSMQPPSAKTLAATANRQGLTRRGFIANLLKQVTSGAEIALLAVPAVVFVAENSGYEPKNQPKKSSTHTNSPPSQTSAAITKNGDIKPIVRGVTHNWSAAADNSDGVITDMRAADIVLMESEQVRSGDKHERTLYGYFATLRAHALKMGKEVYDIDIKHGATRHEKMACSLALLAAACLVVSDLKKGWKAKTRSLRGFFHVLGGAAVCLTAASPSFIASLFLKGRYPVTDISFTIDARTVFMLHHIKRFQKEYPDKKITIIVSSLHAKGFEYYQQNPRIYERKLALYQRIYGHLTGQPEKVISDWDRLLEKTS